MKLVIRYDVGDGYTWNASVVEPFEYESVEKAEYDLLEMYEKWMQARKENDRYIFCDVKFAGLDIDLSNLHDWSDREDKYIYNSPEIKTLEDWWESNLPQKI